MSPRIATLEARIEYPRRLALQAHTVLLLGRVDLELTPAAALEAVLARERDQVQLLALGGELRGYLKGGRLRAAAAWRRGLWVRLGRLAPRLAEYQNLRALRQMGFLAPEPLQAGCALKGLRLKAQWLLTAELAGAGSLQALLAPSDLGATMTKNRAMALVATARELGRLHGLGWFHGDAYPRNVLLLGSDGQFQAGFVNLWRGGALRGQPRERVPQAWLVAWARDLGCFFLHGALWLLPAEQQLFLARYLESLTTQLAERGLRLEARPKLLALAAAARAREARRFARDPRRQVGLPAAPPTLSPPSADRLVWPLRSESAAR
jgi:Lipopolysaccharide kinase (Kdo/WaaP) family